MYSASSGTQELTFADFFSFLFSPWLCTRMNKWPNDGKRFGHIRCIIIHYVCTAGTWSSYNAHKRSQTAPLRCTAMGHSVCTIDLLGTFVHFQTFPGLDTVSVLLAHFVHSCGQDSVQAVHNHFFSCGLQYKSTINESFFLTNIIIYNII